MNTPWYLVKRNWPQNQAKFPFPRYAGLGGDVWPFDANGTTDDELRELHARMARSRTMVDFGSHSRFVCTDALVAEEYFAALRSHSEQAWLLQVALPNPALSQISGFDIGLPSGGFSIIESELIVQGLAGPALNALGLIQTLEESLSFMQERKANEELEQLDEMMIIAINVLSNG